MCKAPKPPKQKDPKKPQFLRNRYLDEFIGDSSAVNSLRTGRSSLRIPLGGPAPVSGRQPGTSLVSPPPSTGSTSSGTNRSNPFQPAAIGPRRTNPSGPRRQIR